MTVDVQDQALILFRKLAFAVYAEIGVLTQEVHPRIAKKADLTRGFFTREHDKQAGQLYWSVVDVRDTESILQPFVERTSLRLNDLEQAFREGKWRGRHGSPARGGPRWAAITKTAIRLKEVIDRGAWDQAEPLLLEIKSLKTNQGRLVEVLDRTERYRPKGMEDVPG